MEDASNDLSALLGENATTVVVREQAIEVQEVTMEVLTEFYSLVKPFFHEFADGGRLALKPTAQADDTAIEAFTLFDVICEHAEPFMEASALVSSGSVEFYRTLRPDEFFRVARKVVEVNGSFFVNALAPALLGLAAALGQLGRTRSDTSSMQGTG